MPLVAFLTAVALGASGLVTVVFFNASAVGSPCQFQEASQPLNIAFCETFDSAAGTGNRAGQLNGTLWGASRQGGFNNFGQSQYDAAVSPVQLTGTCPTQTVTVESDIAICNGEANETVDDNPDITPSNEGTQDDNGTVTSLAMYPKQPFDFAGRTGDIVFDVSDNSGGMHDAWPELWVSSALNTW